MNFFVLTIFCFVCKAFCIAETELLKYRAHGKGPLDTAK